MEKTFTMVDLFAGAGGISEGFKRVCESKGLKFVLRAVNHWPTAVETHSKNHPYADHFCESVFEADPNKVVPEGKLDCLSAAPECIYHSVARGGGPCNEQSRSGAQDVLRWLTAIDVRMLLIENVKEFTSWGPLYKKGPKKNTPIPSQKGVYFRQFLRDLRSLGYKLDYAVLNSANYGAYTARQRFFLIAKKSKSFIDWPEITHVENPDDLFVQQKWHSARDIIDWNLKGKSIFKREKPLCEKTVKRICYGLEKFSGLHLDPWIVSLYGQSKARSIDLPLPTITNGNHLALCEPFVLPQHQGFRKDQLRVKNIDDPLPTITGSGCGSLVQPFLMQYHGGKEGHRRVYDIENPVPTLDTSNRYSLISPYLVMLYGTGNARNIERPLPTITGTGNNIGVAEPFIVKYFGSGENVSCIDNPLPTVTTKDRFGLIEPVNGTCRLDILYRMLEPHELSAAMGFGNDYKFAGTKTDIKKQIGNAVEVNQSTALASVIVGEFLKAA